MASRTNRWLAVLFVGVAISAFDFAMIFIQIKAGDGMSEIALIPTGVTPYALVIESCDLLPGGMAGTAIQVLMESIKGPTRLGVGEGRFLF